MMQSGEGSKNPEKGKDLEGGKKGSQGMVPDIGRRLSQEYDSGRAAHSPDAGREKGTKVTFREAGKEILYKKDKERGRALDRKTSAQRPLGSKLRDTRKSFISEEDVMKREEEIEKVFKELQHRENEMKGQGRQWVLGTSKEPGRWEEESEWTVRVEQEQTEMSRLGVEQEVIGQMKEEGRQWVLGTSKEPGRWENKKEQESREREEMPDMYQRYRR